MNTQRYIARIIMEAETPLFVGSGDSSLLKDALVHKDFNGLPMIPGTALAGVLRHSIEDNFNDEQGAAEKWKKIFGHQDRNDGLGSRLRISSAYLMINETNIAEGDAHKVPENVRIKLDNLPSRQHVRIDHKGAAVKNGLFDNEVVYKGTRFKFEIELIGNESDAEAWNKIIEKLQSPLFRIGQGTRNGYGKMTIAAITSKHFDLIDAEDFKAYTDFDSSLNHDSCLTERPTDAAKSEDTIHYKLELRPDSAFFIFSEGYGDEDVDNKPLEEEVIQYTSNGMTFTKQTVIPASSIKGAIAHRTAFHYNKLKERYADELYPILGKSIAVELYAGSGNKAVNELFGLGAGFAWGSETKDKVTHLPPPRYDEFGDAHRGKVIINDLYYTKEDIVNDKIFNHVAIDRFTGGAMEGALFSEKVSHLQDEKGVDLDIYLEYRDDTQEVHAFENTLLDITKGLLPLGGMTTKGMGIFVGELTKNGQPITSYHLKSEKNGN